MFIGHYSAAFLGKRIAPQVPLPVYFVACQLVDFLWAIFVVLGVEKLRLVPGFTASNPMDLYFMPYTHSLPAALAWSVLALVAYYLLGPPSKRPMQAALIVGAVVGSHWILDLIVHRQDLPLLVADVKVGLGLWDYRYPALLLELGLLWSGALLSLQQAGENRRRYLLLVVAMTALQISTLVVPLPTIDYVFALQLFFLFAALTWGSYEVDCRFGAKRRRVLR